MMRRGYPNIKIFVQLYKIFILKAFLVFDFYGGVLTPKRSYPCLSHDVNKASCFIKTKHVQQTMSEQFSALEVPYWYILA